MCRVTGSGIRSPDGPGPGPRGAVRRAPRARGCTVRARMHRARADASLARGCVACARMLRLRADAACAPVDWTARFYRAERSRSRPVSCAGRDVSHAAASWPGLACRGGAPRARGCATRARIPRAPRRRTTRARMRRPRVDTACAPVLESHQQCASGIWSVFPAGPRESPVMRCDDVSVHTDLTYLLLPSSDQFGSSKMGHFCDFCEVRTVMIFFLVCHFWGLIVKTF